MSPHEERRKTGNHYIDKTLEREGGTRKAKQPLRRDPMLKTQTLMEDADSTQN